jgi:hypothetical protein
MEPRSERTVVHRSRGRFAGPGEATDKARESVRHTEDAVGVAPVNGGSDPPAPSPVVAHSGSRQATSPERYMSATSLRGGRMGRLRAGRGLVRGWAGWAATHEACSIGSSTGGMRGWGALRTVDVGRELRMVFHGAPPAADADDETLVALPPPLVEVTLYSDDSVAFGRMALTASRVTDLLNDETEFELVDAFLQALDDSHALQVRTVVVARGEIFAVGVTGPRADPTRRTRTRQIPVELRVGRYDVNRNIHVVPGASALSPPLGGRTGSARM